MTSRADELSELSELSEQVCWALGMVRRSGGSWFEFDLPDRHAGLFGREHGRLRAIKFAAQLWPFATDPKLLSRMLDWLHRHASDVRIRLSGDSPNQYACLAENDGEHVGSALACESLQVAVARTVADVASRIAKKEAKLKRGAKKRR